jgi:hypothetical protein
MTTPFHLATCALCAKASIPEIEAAIALLDPFVQRELRSIADAVYRELLERLDALSDDLGAADVDALVEAGRNRNDVLAAILAGLLAVVEQGYGAFVSGEFRRRVQEGVETIFRFAERDVGLVLAGPQVELLRQAAVTQLDALLRDTVLGQSLEVRRLLETYLTTATPRAPSAGVLSAAAGDSGLSREQFQIELAERLAPETSANLVLDAWAYLQANVATMTASQQAGFRAFEVVAVGGKEGDGRTTAFCRWAHGRIIPMSRIGPQLALLQDASLRGDAAAIKEAWPFLDGETARKGDELQFERFFRRVGIPPYHHRCRSRARPIRIGRG